MNKSEAQIMKEIEVAVSAAGHKIFRVNVGEGYLYRTQPTQATRERKNKHSRWFKTRPPQGDSDLSDVANPSGKAIFIECKTATGKPTLQQCVFLLAMLAAGANAGIARSAEEALDICDMTDERRIQIGSVISEQLERIRSRRKRPASR